MLDVWVTLHLVDYLADFGDLKEPMMAFAMSVDKEDKMFERVEKVRDQGKRGREEGGGNKGTRE
jgi:hypothetical protein